MLQLEYAGDVGFFINQVFRSRFALAARAVVNAMMIANQAQHAMPCF